MTSQKYFKFHSATGILPVLLSVMVLIISGLSHAQSFVVWNDGGIAVYSSPLNSITGTFPGGTVTAANTGVGNSFSLGQEFNTLNLNGANASQIFATFGATSNPPSTSLTFTFSTPVIIHSFSMHDIDRGSSWHDAFTLSGVTFSSVTTGGGVTASMTGITNVPSNNGNSAEYVSWSTSTTPVTSFTINYQTTMGLTHAYLGYSMEVSIPQNNIDIVGDTITCLGDSVLLTAINDNVHDWAVSSALGTIISSDSAIYVSPTNTTTYAVYGTADTAYHTVYVEEPVQSFTLGNDTTICTGQSLTLDGTALNASDYIWQDASTNTTFQVTQTGVYWVEASNYCNALIDSLTVTVVEQVPPLNLGNDATLCIGQSLPLDATSQYATYYTWQDATTNPLYTVVQSGSYWVEAGNMCGSVSDTINVTFQDPVQQFNLGNDTTLCPGETITLDGTAVNATYYSWQDGSSNPIFSTGQEGLYWLDAGNTCGVVSDSIYITVAELNADLGPDVVMCPGDQLVLDPGNIGTSYTWNDGSTNQTLSVSASGTYWVLVELASCSDYDSVDVVVQELFPAFYAPVTEGCEPLELNPGFQDQSTMTGGNIASWQWSFGDGNASDLQNPDNLYMYQGSYDVTLKIISDIGCEETVTYQNYITVFPKPVAQFGFGPNSGILLETTSIENTSLYSNEWYWDFGDSTSSTLENPVHVYTETQGYSITLYASNEFGCSDTTVQVISIISEPIVYVPNTFTPNGDEMNNSWHYAISEIDTYDFTVTIFNRWGNVIWESHNPEEGWDGTYLGRLVQNGTYIWKIECGSLYNDNRYTFSGHLNVLH